MRIGSEPSTAEAAKSENPDKFFKFFQILARLWSGLTVKRLVGVLSRNYQNGDHWVLK